MGNKIQALGSGPAFKALCCWINVTYLLGAPVFSSIEWVRYRTLALGLWSNPKKQLKKEEELILAHGLRDYSPLWQGRHGCGVSSCLGDQETETGLKAGQDCHLYDLSSSNISPPPPAGSTSFKFHSRSHQMGTMLSNTKPWKNWMRAWQGLCKY